MNKTRTVTFRQDLIPLFSANQKRRHKTPHPLQIENMFLHVMQRSSKTELVAIVRRLLELEDAGVVGK